MKTPEQLIKEALRKPDCKHNHTSYPDIDVKAIMDALRRGGYKIVSKDSWRMITDEEWAQEPPAF